MNKLTQNEAYAINYKIGFGPKYQDASIEDFFKIYAKNDLQTKKFYDWLNIFKDTVEKSIMQKFHTELTLTFLQEFSEDVLTRSKKGLLISGACGKGKLYLAAAIGNKISNRICPYTKRAFSVICTTIQSLITNIQMLFKEPSSLTQPQLYKALKRADVLIISDLGNDPIPEWFKTHLEDIIHYRYSHEIPIIITTTARTKQFLDKNLGQYITYRLLDSCEQVTIV